MSNLKKLKYAFVFTSTILLAGGVIIFFGLVPSPKEIGLPDPDSDEVEQEKEDDGDDDEDVDEQNSNIPLFMLYKN